MNSYLSLSIAALLPVFMSVLLFFADRYTPFKKLKPVVKQIIYGLLFGGLAILGTEWGIPMNEAQVNCRDAAVLTAGILFGGPAGIIAGLIGGVERWFSVYWGVSSFTRVACSISTAIAGLYAAGIRKFLLEGRRPGWLYAFAIGVVMEILHLTMVFITNISNPTEATSVVRACTVPMVLANGISFMLSVVAMTLLSKEKLFTKMSQTKIAKTVQEWLLIAVAVAFTATTSFVYSFQTSLATYQAEELLNIAVNDTKEDIRDQSDADILSVTYDVIDLLPSMTLNEIASTKNIAEINLVGSDGKIYDSTNPEFINYDMHDGPQSEEFLCLLEGTESYVQEYGPISYDSDIYRKYAGVKYLDGFVQVGYDAEQFQKDIAEQVKAAAVNRHIGSDGFMMILDENLNIVSSPNNLLGVSVGENQIDAEQGEMFEISMYSVSLGKNTAYYALYSTTEGYYVISFYAEYEAMSSRNVAIYVNTFMEALMFAILYVMVYALIKHVIVFQLDKVNASLGKIASGDLDETVNARRSEELSMLSDDINETVNTLKQYIADASARIDKELEFAKQIQTSALPKVNEPMRQRREFEVYATMDPAKEVGGDFYDFYFSDNNIFNILIADVSGKGIPAAMFMMRSKAELKSLTESQMPLNEVFTQGNKALCEGNDAGMFVTAWQGQIDLETGNVKFVNAGHNPPLVRKHSTGKFEYLKSRAGFVLAGMDGFQYRVQSYQLEPGDVIFLYTDGVTEAVNNDKKLFGEDRLLDVLNSNEFGSMGDICRVVRENVDRFAEGAAQADDITMLAFRFKGPRPTPTIHFDNASISDITAITEFGEAELEKIGCPMKIVYQMNVAIDEIVSNIINHGYKGKGGPVTMKITYKEETRTLYFSFIDEGIPYNPLRNSDPDITLSAEEREIGGLGIFMVKKTMDDIRYKYEGGHNVLTIVKKLPEKEK